MESLINEDRFFEDKIKLTTIQRDLLIELYNDISLDLFKDKDENRNDKREQIKAISIPRFLNKAKKSFH